LDGSVDTLHSVAMTPSLPTVPLCRQFFWCQYSFFPKRQVLYLPHPPSALTRKSPTLARSFPIRLVLATHSPNSSLSPLSPLYVDRLQHPPLNNHIISFNPFSPHPPFHSPMRSGYELFLYKTPEIYALKSFLQCIFSPPVLSFDLGPGAPHLLDHIILSCHFSPTTRRALVSCAAPYPPFPFSLYHCFFIPARYSRVHLRSRSS